MKTNHERSINRQRGNALVYVLIAIALFAALSFALSRQTDTGEAGGLPDEKAELYATQLISYATQAKSAVDQMLFTGEKIDDLVFTLPTDGAFNTPPHIHKVYHPEGGGLNPATLPTEIVTKDIANPVGGWYMGRFNNVEWTKTAGEDVILVAYQINKRVCEHINKKVNGTTTIPVLTDSIRETMIDGAVYSGTNSDLTTDPVSSPVCGACHKVSSLCVQDQGLNAYAFYTIIADQ